MKLEWPELLIVLAILAIGSFTAWTIISSAYAYHVAQTEEALTCRNEFGHLEPCSRQL